MTMIIIIMEAQQLPSTTVGIAQRQDVREEKLHYRTILHCGLTADMMMGHFQRGSESRASLVVVGGKSFDTVHTGT